MHPLETFLSLAFRNLVPGGLFITSDPNALNPVARYRAYRIRGTPVCKLRMKTLDPEIGTPVYETVERIFSVLSYARMLEKSGFEVRQIEVAGFLGSSLLPSALQQSKIVVTLLTSLQRALQSVPIFRLMGTVYTVVAQKGYGIWHCGKVP